MPGTQPVLLRHAESPKTWLLPLLLRPLPDESGWDAASAYGYGGPIASAPDSLKKIGAGVDEWARENRVVTTFLRFDPVLRNEAWAPPQVALSSPTPTVVWDLQQARPLADTMHPHHRRGARKADRALLTVKVEAGPADLSHFRELYEVTMRRQGADRFYFFPASYWARLSDLGDRLVAVYGLLNGKLIAALLCFRSTSTLHYHLGASLEEARSISANTRLFLTAAEHARELGLDNFHLGGGLGGDAASTLFNYKQRFWPAGEHGCFVTGRWVHDQPRYAQLAEAACDSAYFPPWRAPPDRAKQAQEAT